MEIRGFQATLRLGNYELLNEQGPLRERQLILEVALSGKCLAGIKQIGFVDTGKEN